ncbi:SubName: Full=Uncharacterized protein {ECO:0000313/EMBL:CCA75701.1} [Serendipita indica DSM 11827]|nr:SubName: Full=Uncharacterized protein {ECO:0000313/EMBL:CCA75701.1} [Serendipita indica DSM 11827]
MSYLAPRLHPVSLPLETYPFNLRASLSHCSTTLVISFANSTFTCPNLSPDEASRPATHPPTNLIRIVHPSFTTSTGAQAILVQPASSYNNVVTVGDVLYALHAYLSQPISLDDVPLGTRADVLSYAQSLSGTSPLNQLGPLRRFHLLEGAHLYGGLLMDVAQSNRLLGSIDALQALTWILVTKEPGASVLIPAMYVTPQSSASAAYGPVDEMGRRISGAGNGAGVYPTPPYTR